MQNKSLVLLLFLLLTSCGINMGSGAGQSNYLVESYFKGNGKEMYYVKPITFKSHNRELKIDFSLTVPDSLQRVVAHVSLFTDKSVSQIDSIFYMAADVVSPGANMNLMFKNHSGKQKELRYEHFITQDYFHKMISAPALSIKVYYNGNGEVFTVALRPWHKISRRLREVIYFE